MSNTMACSSCGSIYRVVSMKTPYGQRDKDTWTCDVCGSTLHSWNGAISFSFELLERGSTVTAIVGDGTTQAPGDQ